MLCLESQGTKRVGSISPAALVVSLPLSMAAVSTAALVTISIHTIKICMQLAGEGVKATISSSFVGMFMPLICNESAALPCRRDQRVWIHGDAGVETTQVSTTVRNPTSAYGRVFALLSFVTSNQISWFGPFIFDVKSEYFFGWALGGPSGDFSSGLGPGLEFRLLGPHRLAWELNPKDLAPIAATLYTGLAAALLAVNTNGLACGKWRQKGLGARRQNCRCKQG